MNISICLEFGQPCVISTALLMGSYLPVQECGFTDNSNDFSVHDFLAGKGLDINQDISDVVASQLLERLEIAEYLKDAQCDRDSTTYTPETSAGWKMGKSYFAKFYYCCNYWAIYVADIPLLEPSWS